ncbi:MAG TPA: DUF5818 domain-containing protein [Myxococcaceae bacterium]|nr:DUF5818 domain-containing protein [Myxococcaceae bacterium]
MKLTGRVSFREAEGGVWVLEGDDGRTYQIAGGDGRLRKRGQRIEVEGQVDSTALTFAMVGPVLKVKKYRPL